MYEAEDMKLGRKVALKVLPEETARDPQRRVRFEREVKGVRRALEEASSHPARPKEYSSACRSGGPLFDVTIEPGFRPGRGRPGARLRTRD